MFDGCSSLTGITFSQETFITSKVTNMSGMFSQCGSLRKLEISFFKTENVVDMSSMFKKCSELSNLDLNNFNTRYVENMKSMFEGCTS